MKNQLTLLAVLASALPLTACNVPAVPTGEVTTVIAEVISDAKSVCGIEASVADVAALVGAFVPGVDTAEALANAICSSVAALSGTMSLRYGLPSTRTVKVYLHGNAYSVHVKPSR